MGFPQLSFRSVGNRYTLRGCESAHGISSSAIDPEERLLSRACGDGESFRARNAHGCVDARGEHGPARFSLEESFRSASARRAGGSSEVLRLAAQEDAREARIRTCVRI